MLLISRTREKIHIRIFLDSVRHAMEERSVKDFFYGVGVILCATAILNIVALTIWLIRRYRNKAQAQRDTTRDTVSLELSRYLPQLPPTTFKLFDQIV